MGIHRLLNEKMEALKLNFVEVPSDRRQCKEEKDNIQLKNPVIYYLLIASEKKTSPN